jgi:hypothetical protein
MPPVPTREPFAMPTQVVASCEEEMLVAIATPSGGRYILDTESFIIFAAGRHEIRAAAQRPAQ